MGESICGPAEFCHWDSVSAFLHSYTNYMHDSTLLHLLQCWCAGSCIEATSTRNTNSKTSLKVHLLSNIRNQTPVEPVASSHHGMSFAVLSYDRYNRACIKPAVTSCCIMTNYCREAGIIPPIGVSCSLGLCKAIAKAVPPQHSMRIKTFAQE